MSKQSDKQTGRKRPLLLLLPLAALLLYLYAEKWLRALLLYLSNAGWARQLVTGFPPAWYVVSRFVAGETIADAMDATRALNGQGMQATMDFLGESVTDATEARAARDEILDLLDRIRQTGVNATVSVKLSQLGLKIDPALALDNMHTILERARRYDNFVRIDMEESEVVDVTLDILRTLQEEDGFTNTGAVIQAYLYRSEDDVRRLLARGSSIRLCKGAYLEPPEVAFPDKEEVDANFVRLMKIMLGSEAEVSGGFQAIATHDEAMVRATREYVREQQIRPDSFEFQMLFGIRRELQEELAAQGYRVRIYVPYGTAWYPYFMRRLAERPANLWFFISNFFRR